jgi:hypothetical protein
MVRSGSFLSKIYLVVVVKIIMNNSDNQNDNKTNTNAPTTQTVVCVGNKSIDRSCGSVIDCLDSGKKCFKTLAFKNYFSNLE